MILNSRALALLLALSISVITSAFLSLLPSISATALIVSFALSFSSSYILVRLVLEFIFFKEITSIYEALDKIRSEELSPILSRSRNAVNPLRLINKGIESYAKTKQSEIEELKRMEEFRREFIADVSHELKTPIFAAQGFVHTLLDGAVEDKKVRTKFLKKAAKSLDGLDMLVQDLLTISQMETGDIKMHPEDFNIEEMVREVMDQVDGKAEKRNVEVRLEGLKEPAYVFADYQRIYQVLSNLITNGIKYSEKGSLVKIFFERSDDDVTIFVKDNGLGIPEEDIGRIFERFYRVDKSRSKAKGGTGLGLSIVKHILEGHQSKIEVESEEGVGSKFWFKLRLGKVPEYELLNEDDD